MITQERLKELLDYNPETGIFTYAISRMRVKKGLIAGNIKPNGYLSIFIDGKRYYLHRLAWLYVHGTWPKNHIDHINNFKNDNRIENLRDVTQRENT